MQRDQLDSHIKRATKGHFNIACGELRKTQEKLKEKIIHLARLGERVHILNEQLDKLSDIQHQHQYKVDSLQQQQQQRIGTLQEQLEQKVKTCETKLEQKIGMERKIYLVCLVLGLVLMTFYLRRFEDRVQKNLEDRLRVMQSLEDRVQNVGMAKKELEKKFDSLNKDSSYKLSILEVDTEKFRSFIWKITSFKNELRKRKNNEQRFIKSIPFYAYGYKLMLKLYPNGYRDGENTHLSIFVSVRKGEYDGVLPKVFSKQVTFTLIDQQDNRNRRRLNVVKEFTADFEKPVGNKINSGWGLTKFLSLNTVWQRRFVVNDTLFIKVQVESPRAKT